MGRTPSPSESVFGNQLQKLRLQKGWKQSDLAREVNLTPSAIGSYERGVREPNIENLIAFSKIFETTTDHLLGLNEKEERPEEKTFQAFQTNDLRVILNKEDVTINGVPIDHRTKERLLDILTGMSLMI